MWWLLVLLQMPTGFLGKNLPANDVEIGRRRGFVDSAELAIAETIKVADSRWARRRSHRWAMDR